MAAPLGKATVELAWEPLPPQVTLSFEESVDGIDKAIADLQERREFVAKREETAAAIDAAFVEPVDDTGGDTGA